MPHIRGTTIVSANEKKVRIMIDSLAAKDAIREPPIEIKQISSYIRGSDRNMQNASIYKGAKLSPQWKVRVSKDLETRKKVDGWNHICTDESMEGAGSIVRQPRSGRNEILTAMEAPFYREELAAADDTFLMDYVRKSKLKLGPFDATKGASLHERNCFQKGIFSRRCLPLRTEDRHILDMLSQNELMMDGTFLISRKEILDSPSGSDSSSSLALLESSSSSSSSSCNSRMNFLAKGELSPFHVPSKFLQSTDLTGDYMTGGDSLPLLYISSPEYDNNYDKRQEITNKAHFQCKKTTCDQLSETNYGQLQLQRNYLDLKFLERRIVEGSTSRNIVTTSVLVNDCKPTKMQPATQTDTETVEGAIGRGTHYDLIDSVSSDEEWASGLASPAFYSASACSPESCSDMSQHSHETGKRDLSKWIEAIKVGLQRNDGAEPEGNNATGWNMTFYDDNSCAHVDASDSTFHTSVNVIPQTLGDPTVKKPNLEDGVSRNPTSKERDPVHAIFISPTSNWQNPIGQCGASLDNEPIQQHTISSECTSQVISKSKNEPGSKSTRSALSTKCILLDSKRTAHYVCDNLVNKTMFNSDYRKTSSELEIACNPFPLVPKPNHCLPGPKGDIGSGKYLTSTVKQDNPLSKHSSMGETTNRSTLHGHLQWTCKDGLPLYTFLLDNSEDVFMARGCKSENCPGKEDYIWIYTFHSGKTKGKDGWKTWGRKDKPIANLAGKMKVCSILHPKVTSSGEINHSVESEFVLFDGNADVAECQSSRFMSVDMTLQHSSSPFYKKPALNSTGGLSSSRPDTCVSPLIIPRQHHLSEEDIKMENANYQLQRGSPLRGHRPNFSVDVWSDIDMTDVETGFHRFCPSHLELAAIVINIPAGAQGQASGRQKIRKETGGWGLKFLEISSKRNATMKGRKDQSMVIRNKDYLKGTDGFVCSASEDTTASRGFIVGHDEKLLTGNYCEDMHSSGFIGGDKPKEDRQEKRDEIIKRSGFSPGNETATEGKHHEYIHSNGFTKIYGSNKDQEVMWDANVTVVLPTGSHGLPSAESSGPSTLIERWKSGGSCDCGGWDLGCGLTILSTQRPSLYSLRESVGMTKESSIGIFAANNPFRIFSQGSRQDIVAFSLEVIQDGFFSLSFQAQFTELQAFAIAIAVLHSNEMIVSIGLQDGMGESAKAPSSPKVPKMWPNLNRSGSKSRNHDIMLSSQL